MTDSPPVKKRNLSLTLIATFLIGVGIGASLTYAALEAMGVDFSTPNGSARQIQEASLEEATAPTEATAPAEAAPAPPATPLAELQADVTGLWPARHLFVVLPRAPLSPETLHYLNVFKPGGVVIRPDSMQSAAQVIELVREIKSEIGLGLGRNTPPLVIFDPQKTAIQNLGIENLPSPQSIGAMNDEAIAQRAGQDVGRALADRSFSMFLGPVLDVYEPGVSEPWLANLALGARPSLVAAVGVAYARGVEEGGVLPMVAHYPGLGHARYDDAGVYTIPHTDLRALATLMFPFSKSAAENVPAMLVGHAAVPGLDEEQPTRPAALSPILVRQVIRETWLYEGVLIADDVSEHAMTRDMPLEEAVVAALAAGNDGVLVSNMDMEKLAAIASAMKEALREGGLQQDRLNESKQRLDMLQQRLPAAATDLLPEGEDTPEEEATEADATEAPAEGEPAPTDIPETEASDTSAETEETEAPAPTDGAAPEMEESEAIEEEAPTTEAEISEESGEAAPTTVSTENTISYTVKEGDNLRRIAEAFDTSVDTLVQINDLESANVIRLGQRLRVPAPDSPSSGD